MKKKLKKKIKKLSRITAATIEELMDLTYNDQIILESDCYTDEENIVHSVITFDIPIAKIQ